PHLLRPAHAARPRRRARPRPRRRRVRPRQRAPARPRHEGEVMTVRRFVLATAALGAVSATLAVSGFVRSATAERGGIATRSYVQTNLVSDIPGLAAHTDPNLKNPWGTSVGPGSPIRVSDHHAGVATPDDGPG